VATKIHPAVPCRAWRRRALLLCRSWAPHPRPRPLDQAPFPGCGVLVPWPLTFAAATAKTASTSITGATAGASVLISEIRMPIILAQAEILVGRLQAPLVTVDRPRPRLRHQRSKRRGIGLT
jgi:hypothetical protein